MEKFTDRTRAKSCRRLLIFFSLLFVLGKSFIFAASPYEGLIFEYESNQFFMTDTDLEFSLVVPGAAAKNVSLKLPELGKNLTCTSMTKSDYYDDENKRSTLIEITLVASEKGFYQLNPAILTVSRRGYSVYFDRFEIKENPKKIQPELIVKLSDLSDKNVKQLDFRNGFTDITMEKNKAYKFLVYVKGISSVDYFEWKIPLNSIFTLKNDWESAAKSINSKAAKFPKEFFSNKYSEVDSSVLNQAYETEFLLAEFEWTPLASKENEFPYLQLGCHSFSNGKYILEGKNVRVKTVENSSSKSLGHTLDNYFGDAFSVDEEQMEQKKALSFEECEKIAAEEKSKLSFFKKLSRKSYGIILKTDLYSIPEENASRFIQIDAGTKVEILEETKGWIFVSSVDGKEKSGWCKKDKVIFIK